jgi:hypothetical protein
MECRDQEADRGGPEPTEIVETSMAITRPFPLAKMEALGFSIIQASQGKKVFTKFDTGIASNN